jgi:hypothetical protein
MQLMWHTTQQTQKASGKLQARLAGRDRAVRWHVRKLEQGVDSVADLRVRAQVLGRPAEAVVGGLRDAHLHASHFCFSLIRKRNRGGVRHLGNFHDMRCVQDTSWQSTCTIWQQQDRKGSRGAGAGGPRRQRGGQERTGGGHGAEQGEQHVQRHVHGLQQSAQALAWQRGAQSGRYRLEGEAALSAGVVKDL